MITIQNFSKKYKKTDVLKNVNVEFPHQEINFLMGKNGAGKTTLIKCITKLEGYEGEIFIEGCDYNVKRGKFMVLWFDCPFYDNFTGSDNMSIFSCKNYKNELERKVEDFIAPDLFYRRVKTIPMDRRRNWYLP